MLSPKISTPFHVGKGIPATHVIFRTTSLGNMVPEFLSPGRQSRIERIVTFDGDQPSARAGQAVTVTQVRDSESNRVDLFYDNQNNRVIRREFTGKYDETFQPTRSHGAPGSCGAR